MVWAEGLVVVARGGVVRCGERDGGVAVGTADAARAAGAGIGPVGPPQAIRQLMRPVSRREGRSGCKGVVRVAVERDVTKAENSRAGFFRQRSMGDASDDAFGFSA